MKLTNDGGPTYPTANDNGMTLRDFFAAAALQGYLAAHSGCDATPDPGDAANEAFELADAMIRARTAARKPAATA